MQSLEIRPPTWYATVFHWTVLGTMLTMIAACFTNRIYSASTRKSFDAYAKLFVILITVLVGLRPRHAAFGDTVNYARGFDALVSSHQADWMESLLSFKGEFTFSTIQDICAEFANLPPIGSNFFATHYAIPLISNALGCIASVVPSFCEQIARSDSVPDTHPGTIRHFTTFPKNAVRVLKQIVPEFKSKNSPFEKLDTPASA